jgi:hypothetical protein
MPISFGLVVQRIPRAADQVLVIGHLVGSRAGDGWFTPGEVARMFETLRLPTPGGVSQALGRLKDAGLVMRRGTGGSWSVTPVGGERTRELVGEVDVADVEAEIVRSGGAELAQGEHPLIPPELAPIRWAVGISRLLSRFSFDHNVFLVTRFPREEREGDLPDPVRAVVTVAREALSRHGLRLHLASDRTADDELFGNIAAHMWACKYGIGLFETRYGADFNDNLQIEVGAMLMTGRRVALLKDLDTPNMPTDFVGHIYKAVDFEDLDAVAGAVHRWAAEDLGLGPCTMCEA